jgi:polyvinyl alcohol dehydrogenase (cytochrome)
VKRAVLAEAFVFALILLVLGGERVPAQSLRSVWPVSGHDLSNTRYRPGERIYVANVNSNREHYQLVRPPPGSPKTTEGGFWCALDARTGEILWQTADPSRKKTEGAVTVANGVVFAGSMGRRPRRSTMFALSAETGKILWRFASGATVDAGPAVADGTVFWGSGYPPIKQNGGTKNDRLFAFALAPP